MKIRITYEVEDGYAGKSRPQHFTFDSDDYVEAEEWEKLTEEEKTDLIYEATDDDFDNKISWAITNREEAE